MSLDDGTLAPIGMMTFMTSLMYRHARFSPIFGAFAAMIVPGRDDEMCLAAGLFKLAEIAGAAFMPKVWMIDDAQVHIRPVFSRLTSVAAITDSCCSLRVSFSLR